MRARLLVESGNATPQDSLLLGSEAFTLGRNKGNHLILGNTHASRHHAEIYREKGSWFLRDLGGVNGTFINDRYVKGAIHPLPSEGAIRICDIVLRFIVEPSERPTDELPIPKPLSDEANTPPPSDNLADHHPTPLEPDEMTSLLGFMDASLRESTPSGVIQLALETVHHRLRATIAGFLSLEQDDPLPKMVVPMKSKVDIHLSRKLTQCVAQTGKRAWLSDTQSTDVQTDSVISYQDALVVPIQGGTVPLGALHVYRNGLNFTAREVRYCEALSGHLGRCLHILRSQRALEADNSRLRVHTSTGDSDLIGESPPMKLLKQQIRKLADGPKILLFCGESGSGKELIALAVHRQSKRREGPLVPVNCAAILASMPESELFGHVKGAFTGADRAHDGYFAQADMGTLFLDEIGELSEECQAKLLRVLDQGTFRPIGARQEQRADVRILAATNRDLKRECQEGRFRQDLFFRLGVGIQVAPLRERREDIPALVAHFLTRLSVEYRRPVQLADEAMERLKDYPWPGNIRQLRSVLEYAVAMSDGPIIRVDELHLFAESSLSTPKAPTLNLEELEKGAIRQALDQAQGTITQAAKLLGIHRDTLMAKMKKYDIEK